MVEPHEGVTCTLPSSVTSVRIVAVESSGLPDGSPHLKVILLGHGSAVRCPLRRRGAQAW